MKNTTKINGNVWIRNEMQGKGARTYAGATLAANCLHAQTDVRG